MTTEKKVELVESVYEEEGLAPALSALELPKSTWYYHKREKVSYQEKYSHIRPMLEEIAREHPSYGIPRVTKELRENYNQVINHKVIQRLLKLWDLSMIRNIRIPKASGISQVIIKAGDRANLIAQMEKISPFSVAYTDFTEIRFANGNRKAYLMPIIGHVCKMVYGWSVSSHANSQTALTAWEMAKVTLRELGERLCGDDNSP